MGREDDGLMSLAISISIAVFCMGRELVIRVLLIPGSTALPSNRFPLGAV